MNTQPKEFTDDDQSTIDVHRFINNYTRKSFLAKFGFDFFTEEPSEEEEQKKVDDIINQIRTSREKHHTASKFKLDPILWAYIHDSLLGPVRFFQVSPTYAIEQVNVGAGKWVDKMELLQKYNHIAEKYTITDQDIINTFYTPLKNQLNTNKQEN
jgi:hypothetical protein